MPGGVEWGLVAVTEDLYLEARQLGQLGWEFSQEARSWTHPAGRSELNRLGNEVKGWAQQAALAAGTGDYWSRLEAVRLAMQRRRAAQVALRQWWEKGELWNSHRMRAVPASIRGVVLA